MDKRTALLNKAALAKQLKVSRELVSRWFRTKSVPKKWRKKVAQATGIAESGLG